MVGRGEPPNRLRTIATELMPLRGAKSTMWFVANVVPARSVSFDMHGAFGCDHDEAVKPILVNPVEWRPAVGRLSRLAGLYRAVRSAAGGVLLLRR